MKKDWRAEREQQQAEEKARAEEREAKVAQWSFRPGDVRDADWTHIAHLKRSKEGSTGVFFVDRPSGTVVIKGCTNIVSEYFSLRLANILGLVSPQARVIDWSRETFNKSDRKLVNEWSEMKASLIHFVEQHGAGGSEEPEADARKVGAELDRGFLLVMSVIIGKDMDRLGPETCAELFADATNPIVQPEVVLAKVMTNIPTSIDSPLTPNTNDSETEIAPLPRPASKVVYSQTKAMTTSALMAKRCRGFGQMIAFDALCNNGDRLPALWPNAGNFHNVFVEMSPERTCVAYIDNQVNPFSGPTFETYADNIRLLLTALVSEPFSIFPTLDFIRSRIQEETLVDIGVQGVRNMQLGVLEGIVLIHEKLTIQTVEALIEEMKTNTIKSDWSDVWANDCAKLDRDYFDQILNIFAEFVPRARATLVQFPLSRDLSALLSIPPADFAYSNIKVLICQSGPTQSRLHLQAKDALDKEIASTGRKPDFLIFPEGWFCHGGAIDLHEFSHCSSDCAFKDAGLNVNEEQQSPKGQEKSQLVQTLSRMCSLARDYGVYIIAGTFMESDGAKVYITTVTISDTGKILGKYRKRFPMSSTLGAGTEVAIYDSKFGRFGILICFDIENQAPLQETLAEKPFAIFNPVHIPPNATLRNKSSLNEWRSCSDMMRRNIEHIAWKHNCAIVRCDVPLPIGSGSSQLIAPNYSEIVETFEASNFTVYIENDSSNRFYGFCTPDADRTANEDNNGSRYWIRNLIQQSSFATFYGLGSTLLYACASGSNLILVDNKDLDNPKSVSLGNGTEVTSLAAGLKYLALTTRENSETNLRCFDTSTNDFLWNSRAMSIALPTDLVVDFFCTPPGCEPQLVCHSNNAIWLFSVQTGEKILEKQLAANIRGSPFLSVPAGTLSAYTDSGDLVQLGPDLSLHSVPAPDSVASVITAVSAAFPCEISWGGTSASSELSNDTNPPSSTCNASQGAVDEVDAKIHGLAFTSVLVGTDNGFLRLLCVETGKLLKEIQVGSSRISRILPIESSSRTYLVAAGNTIYLYSISAQLCYRVHAFESHSHEIRSLEFNRKSGNQFLSADASGRTKLWSFLQNQNEKIGLTELMKNNGM